VELPEIAAPFKNARLSDAGLAFLLAQTSRASGRAGGKFYLPTLIALS
jgi:hypothetical protein